MTETRILVVEDEAATAETIRADLRSLGYAVPAGVISGRRSSSNHGR